MQAFPVGTQVRPLNMLRGGLGSWMLLAYCGDIIALSISCCCWQCPLVEGDERTHLAESVLGPRTVCPLGPTSNPYKITGLLHPSIRPPENGWSHFLPPVLGRYHGAPWVHNVEPCPEAVRDWPNQEMTLSRQTAFHRSPVKVPHCNPRWQHVLPKLKEHCTVAI